jgi:hypothetical protein
MAEMAAADDRNIQTAFDGNFVGRQYSLPPLTDCRPLYANDQQHSTGIVKAGKFQTDPLPVADLNQWANQQTVRCRATNRLNGKEHEQS